MNEEKVIKRRNRKPSAKMIKYGKMLAAGEHTLVEAYRLCYAAENMTDATTRNEASALANHPSITMIVEEEKSRLSSLEADKQSQKQMADAVQHTSDRERVLTRLRTWLDLPPESPLQLRAAEILARAVGLNNQVIVSDQRDSMNVAAEIEAMLLAANVTTADPSDDDADQPEQLH
tara:strand:- start:1183 stop:1710 length:528 start_codon:yes stop_codon:yes gene_type:complete